MSVNLDDVLPKTPHLGDLVNLLSRMAPQYSSIGLGLKVDMEKLGLDIPTSQFYQRSLQTTLQEWLNNGNNPNDPEHYYKVNWDNIIVVIRDINFKVADQMTDFIQKPETIQRYSKPGEPAGPVGPKAPQLGDLMNVLSRVAPQYSSIGLGLKVDMERLGLSPDQGNHQRNLTTTLQEWLNNGNNPNDPEHFYKVNWENIIKVIDGLNFKTAEKMRDFLKDPSNSQKYLIAKN